VSFNEDARSSIAAAPAVDREAADQEPVDQDLAPVRSRMDPAVRAGPCTQRGLSPVELPAPADGLVLAPPGPDSVPGPDLARPALVSVAQVA
jgi:hypothetical protein